ncbi:MAG: AMP-binding protein [Gammaproteobacteria bacterium]|nr:AMP-binding protein [Gammaproteobacteria bacterium]
MQFSDKSTIVRPQRLLRDGLLASAQRYPHKEALVVEGKGFTYMQVVESSLSLAAALKDRGLQRGDRVVIFIDNSWPCIISIYGTLLAGGVFVVVNPQTKSDKLSFILNDCEARFLISNCYLENIYSPALENVMSVIAVITSGTRSNKQIKVTPVESFENLVEHTKPLPAPVDVIPNDLAALIYTSGSTGTPKGVMQTHQAMVFAAWSLIEYQRLTDKDRIMLVLPIAFDYGLYQLLMAMKLGATLIVEKSFAFPADIYTRIKEQQATVLPAVPTIFATMISSYKKKEIQFPGIKRITNTAASLSKEFIPYLHQIFPNALIYSMYGLTECKRVSYLEPELIDVKPESVGKAIPGTEVYLLTPEGNPVAPGEKGILYVRGPHIMAGYWKQPQLTDEMLKPGKLPGERVLCTHDWFKMDDEGFLYFAGRTDDIIKTRGEKVSPLEVEKTLVQIEGIEEAAVIGVDDEILGQAIRAFVVADSASKLDGKKIKQLCLAKLENYMAPRDVIFLDKLPKNSNGKIDKQSLKQFTVN